MKLGITATRQLLARRQYLELARFILSLDVDEVHHGDCVGGDETAHVLAAHAGRRIVIHPPTDRKLRAFCDLIVYPSESHIVSEVTVLGERPYLDRDHDIVDDTDLLVGVPSGPERQRSGTWATIRYARKIGRPVAILMPGHTLYERDWRGFRLPTFAELPPGLVNV